MFGIEFGPYALKIYKIWAVFINRLKFLTGFESSSKWV